MDARIMVAVLASLLVVATGMESGLNVDDVRKSIPGGGDLTGAFSLGQVPLERGGNHTVSADLELDELEGQTVYLEEADLFVGETNVSLSSGNLSGRGLRLEGFSGDLKPGKQLGVSGDIEGWSSESSSFSGSSSIDTTVELENFSVVVRGSDLSLSGVRGRVRVDGAETSFSDLRDLQLSDFRGGVNLSTSNSSVDIAGSASRIEAGSLLYR